MLAVPCGLQSYLGPWPPVVKGAPVIEPLAGLAGVSAHCAARGPTATPTRRPVAHDLEVFRTAIVSCSS